MRVLKLEKDVEQEVVDWWKPRLQLKLNGLGQRGYPDRLFFVPGGKAVFIEFKRRGAKPRPLQDYIHRKLSEMGFEIYVCDTVIAAKACLAGRGIPRPRGPSPDLDGMRRPTFRPGAWEDFDSFEGF